MVLSLLMNKDTLCFKTVDSGSAMDKTGGTSMGNSDTIISFSKMGREIGEPVIVDLMNQALKNPDLLSLAAGFTDDVVMPREIVSKLVAELTGAPTGGATLQYGTN